MSARTRVELRKWQADMILTCCWTVDVKRCVQVESVFSAAWCWHSYFFWYCKVSFDEVPPVLVWEKIFSFYNSFILILQIYSQKFMVERSKNWVKKGGDLALFLQIDVLWYCVTLLLGCFVYFNQSNFLHLFTILICISCSVNNSEWTC